MKTRAAVLERFGAPLEVQELDLAESEEGEVLVRLVACGVRHTHLLDRLRRRPVGLLGRRAKARWGDVIASHLRPQSPRYRYGQPSGSWEGRASALPQFAASTCRPTSGSL